MFEAGIVTQVTAAAGVTAADLPQTDYFRARGMAATRNPPGHRKEAPTR